MKEWLLRTGVLAWLVAVTGSVIVVLNLVDSTYVMDRHQAQLSHQLQELKAEHKALQVEHKALQSWVDTKLLPWVKKQVKEALPPNSPSLAPLPPVPSTSPDPSVDPSPSPTPSPDPIPSTPPLPTSVPTPSPVCLPVIGCI